MKNMNEVAIVTQRSKAQQTTLDFLGKTKHEKIK